MKFTVYAVNSFGIITSFNGKSVLQTYFYILCDSFLYVTEKPACFLCLDTVPCMCQPQWSE